MTEPETIETLRARVAELEALLLEEQTLRHEYGTRLAKGAPCTGCNARILPPTLCSECEGAEDEAWSRARVLTGDDPTTSMRRARRKGS